MESYALLIAATLNAGTVLAIAALGLLINEKAGVVNLGAEGMMLCAAIAGFAAVVHTGSDFAGFVAGMAAGATLAALFGARKIKLETGLADPEGGPLERQPFGQRQAGEPRRWRRKAGQPRWRWRKARRGDRRQQPVLPRAVV